ncbi:MAG: hypothetical protein JWM57_1734, partial [Phycisphaerales bacterium]|nr:hypothetical protein [Phycisphaerales bacterium]
DSGMGKDDMMKKGDDMMMKGKMMKDKAMHMGTHGMN